MNHHIRIATSDDLPSIMEVIADAKQLLKESGSPQWQDSDGYPNEQTFLNDISLNQLYVCINKDNNQVIGVVVISKIPDECYNKITNGQWLSNQPYYVIHRLAARKGFHVGYELINYAKQKAKQDNISSVRADTMDINIPMRKLLSKCGFSHCGTIILERCACSDPRRMAFEILL